MPIAWIAVAVGAAFLLRAFALFALHRYEEPTLTRTYGEEYLDYRRNVPGWWPRLTPWRA
ncbi:hypothetical protein [Arthrobacter sp. UYCu712]|uniref:hypothetical protein n=1 Tax=Arthrobacter sp. UYCu712 TaxID=3156340 RepID=UPI003392437A